jgi:hypothetical protein
MPVSHEILEYIEAFYPYRTFVENEDIGFRDMEGKFLPWFFIPVEKMFDVNEFWSSGYTGRPLIAFARRQDCDDFSCFLFENGEIVGIETVEGWSGGAYSKIAEYSNFEDWLKSIQNDIAMPEA